MGNKSTIQRCNYEDIHSYLRNIENNRNNGLLINTLEQNMQHCLIPKTINYKEEETTINHYLSKNTSIHIFIYGKNSNDESIYEKYNQLLSLGFTNIYVYTGGLFEWLCLQDIYGDDIFPTTSKQLDILKYKPESIQNKKLKLMDM